MRYGLCHGVSFCFAGDRAIVLDLKRDRYFGLTSAQARALLSGDGADPSLEPLVRQNILQEVVAADSAPRPCAATPARRRLSQNSQPSQRGADWLGVALAVCSAQLELKGLGLQRALARLASRKADLLNSAGAQDPDAMMTLARRFNAARPLAPLASVCLLDSLALSTYLAKRGFIADLIFGVDAPPFSAHAWVQCGDVVLNDDVDRVAIYTPILVA